jgi:hypothetical protein
MCATSSLETFLFLWDMERDYQNVAKAFLKRLGMLCWVVDGKNLIIEG